jgi:Zn-dependent metalloprotease
MRCTFIPPDVQKSLARWAKGGPADDPAQAELAKQARQARASRLAAVAEAAVAEAPLAPGALPATGAGLRVVFDSQNTTNMRHFLVRAEGHPTTADGDVTAAYEAAGVVRVFVDQVLNRHSIDDLGMDLILNVHYGTSYNNAFWDGDEMTFGDGDGVVFSGFAGSLDVVAHELAHGITQFTAGLVYKNQPGALNEHFSDVFGTAVTQWAAGESPADADWLIGDEIMGPDLYGEALRSMAHPGQAFDNPIIGGDNQRAHMDDLYTGTADNGGVHWNSGIPNRAFHLTSIELGDTIAAARIWYHALQHLAADATFTQAAERIVESARVLVKSGEVRKGAPQIVRGAFAAVGIG